MLNELMPWVNPCKSISYQVPCHKQHGNPHAQRCQRTESPKDHIERWKRILRPVVSAGKPGPSNGRAPGL